MKCTVGRFMSCECTFAHESHSHTAILCFSQLRGGSSSCFAASFSNVININSPISSSKWNEIKCLTRGMTHLTWWHFHVPDMSPHRKMTSSSSWFIQQWKDLIAALSRLLKGSIFEFQFPSTLFFITCSLFILLHPRPANQWFKQSWPHHLTKPDTLHPLNVLEWSWILHPLIAYFSQSASIWSW